MDSLEKFQNTSLMETSIFKREIFPEIDCLTDTISDNKSILENIAKTLSKMMIISISIILELNILICLTGI